MNKARRLGILQKTQDQNKWVANVWCDWVRYWSQIPCVKNEEEQHQLLEDFCKMSTKDMKLLAGKVCT